MITLLLLKLPVPELKKKKALISTYLAERKERFIDEADYKKKPVTSRGFITKNLLTKFGFQNEERDTVQTSK